MSRIADTTMTHKLNIDNYLQGGKRSTPAPNRRLVKWRVKWLIVIATT